MKINREKKKMEKFEVKIENQLNTRYPSSKNLLKDSRRVNGHITLKPHRDFRTIITDSKIIVYRRGLMFSQIMNDNTRSRFHEQFDSLV